MDQLALAQILQELIVAIDPTSMSMEALYETAVPFLNRISGLLRVAKIVTEIHIAPNAFNPDGDEKRRTLDFGHEPGPDADALVLEGDQQGPARSTTTAYPWKGHRWNDDERLAITAVGKLIYGQASRISMFHMQQKLVFTDQLTGLNNIPAAMRFCGQIAAQHGFSGYASCFLNLKNLKYINRQMGNPAGDAIMRRYAGALNRMLDPQREQLARLGGDNFFALVLKERLPAFLQKAVAMPIEHEHDGHASALTLGAWAGVYLATGGEDPRDLLDYASFAYERAKQAKTTVAYFNPEMMEANLRARKISQIFPEALRNGEFVPFYQPKVSMHTGNLYGCEALVRWLRHGKVIPPSEFIPVAETSDQITELDLYMLDAVCRDIRGWIDAGIEPVCVSINYSQRDFYRETLIEDTLAALRRYDVDGRYLEIEITETSFFENFAALEKFVEAMHAHGVKVSLDDFGTGYSSLTLFESLNLDTVKLDRSFFLNMDENQTQGHLVLHSVADMLNQMKKVTVSEGVETPAQLAVVDEIGCDIVQGFYFDRPLPHDDFTERLKVKHYKVGE